MTDPAEAGAEARPSLADQRGVDREQVYQPAEDSRLLAEAVVDRVEPGDMVLDVGTGSGYVAARARDAGAKAVGIDVNPHACRQAAENGLPVVRGDMTNPISDGAFDLVAFNPPYLPTDPDAEWNDWMEAALSGGEDGRAAVEPFLDDVERVLAPDGAALLLVSTLTDPGAVEAYAAERGLATDEVESESYPFERLLVLRLTRQTEGER